MGNGGGTMAFRFDHAVILVDDLQAAVEDYATLGFNVTPGGEHTEWDTHNALIAFADGGYLELLAFKAGLAALESLDPPPYSLLQRVKARSAGEEGLFDFALLSTSIEADVEAASKRGLAFEGLLQGGRQRPDGQLIGWQMAMPHAPMLPFIIADITPRSLRVPGGDACQHPNGAVGVMRLDFAASAMATGVANYGALLGVTPLQDLSIADSADFNLGETAIRLCTGRAGGDRPLALALRVQDGHPVRGLDLALTHNVRIDLLAG